jgi:hypothetical protein
MDLAVKWITSPVKITCQVATGNFSGANETTKDLVVSTPVISHAAAGVVKLCGEDEAASQLWSNSNKNLNHITNSIPVVGHAKGLVHYACDDPKGGNEAMTTANNSTAAIGNCVGELLSVVPKTGVALVTIAAETGTNIVESIHPNSASWDTWENDQ